VTRGRPLPRWTPGVALALALSASALAPRPAGALTEDDLIEAPGSPTDRYIRPEELRAVLHAANDAFFGCFRDRVSGPDPGDVNVYFTVNNSGRPTQVRAEVPGAVPGLGECLEGIVHGLVFQDHDGDPIEAAYPVVFVRDEKGVRVVPYPVVFTRERKPEFLLLPVPPALTDDQRALLLRLLWPEG